MPLPNSVSGALRYSLYHPLKSLKVQECHSAIDCESSINCNLLMRRHFFAQIFQRFFFFSEKLKTQHFYIIRRKDKINNEILSSLKLIKYLRDDIKNELTQGK